jgi:hypothetical protein
MTGNRIMIAPEPVTAAVPSAALAHPAKPNALEQLLPRLCMQCGAVGTHYLTCPSLRLPPGYRLSEDPGPERLRGLENGTCGVGD